MTKQTDEELEPIMQRVAMDCMVLAQNDVEQLEVTLDGGVTMLVTFSLVAVAIATPKATDDGSGTPQRTKTAAKSELAPPQHPNTREEGER